ncbi:hypothetical protein Tco_0305001 [Tanacetum coccineum]
MMDEDEDDQSIEDNNDHIVNNDNANSEGEVEAVPETVFGSEEDQNGKHSEDPFEIYKLLNKDKTKTVEKDNGEEKEQSFQYPPGFTPNVDGNKGNVEADQVVNENVENIREDCASVNIDNGIENLDSSKTDSGPSRSGRFKISSVSRTGGSILNLMEQVVKVGQTMGYNMDGCVKDIEEIIESQGELVVNR